MAGRSVESQIIDALRKCRNQTAGGPIRRLPDKLKLRCGWKLFIPALNKLVADNKVTRSEGEGKRVEITLISS